MQFTVTKEINRISLPIKAIGQINSLNQNIEIKKILLIINTCLQERNQIRLWWRFKFTLQSLCEIFWLHFRVLNTHMLDIIGQLNKLMPHSTYFRKYHSVSEQSIQNLQSLILSLQFSVIIARDPDMSFVSFSVSSFFLVWRPSEEEAGDTWNMNYHNKL